MGCPSCPPGGGYCGVCDADTAGPEPHYEREYVARCEKCEDELRAESVHEMNTAVFIHMDMCDGDE